MRLPLGYNLHAERLGSSHQGGPRNRVSHAATSAGVRNTIGKENLPSRDNQEASARTGKAAGSAQKPAKHLRQCGSRSQDVGGHHVAWNDVKHALLLRRHTQRPMREQQVCIMLTRSLQPLHTRQQECRRSALTLWQVNVAMPVAKPSAMAVGPALLPKYLVCAPHAGQSWP